MILAGHARVEAAKQLGMDRVPTICVDHLNEVRKRAYVLADNRPAMRQVEQHWALRMAEPSPTHWALSCRPVPDIVRDNTDQFCDILL